MTSQDEIKIQSDRIKRLEQENARLREALRRHRVAITSAHYLILGWCREHVNTPDSSLVHRSRNLLKEHRKKLSPKAFWDLI